MKLASAALVSIALASAWGCADAPRPAPPAPSAASAALAPAASAAPTAPQPGYHADHSPKHGGILVMDPNLYHHLEGTLPEAGLFRLYLYDDYTKPIDARGTTGTIALEGSSARIPLQYDEATQTLVARLDPPPALPAAVQLAVLLTNPKTGASAETSYAFTFHAVGGEPAPAEAEGGHSHGDGHSHSHGSEDHAHVAPHGGQVATVGADHHFELVATPGMLTLWILDANEATLPVDGMEATLLIQPEGRAPVTLPLPAMGSVHFMGPSPLKEGEKAVVVANVKIAGTTRSARFTLP